jgi:esterase/lipase superfamily enzyme
MMKVKNVEDGLNLRVTLKQRNGLLHRDMNVRLIITRHQQKYLLVSRSDGKFSSFGEGTIIQSIASVIAK